MGTLRGHGVSIELPSGWEGRVRSRAHAGGGPGVAAAEAAEEVGAALLHAANFPLPPDTADFGGGAVDIIRARDLLVVLFEYGPTSVGTALFSATGMPRLTIDDFSPLQLAKLIEGQAGAQRFFTEAGRAFCLYVVLGSHVRRRRTVAYVNEVLATLSISS